MVRDAQPEHRNQLKHSIHVHQNLRFNDGRLDQLAPYDRTKPGDPTAGPLNENVDILGRRMAITIGIQGNATTFSKEKRITAKAFNPTACTNRFIWPAGSKEPEDDF